MPARRPSRPRAEGAPAAGLERLTFRPERETFGGWVGPMVRGDGRTGVGLLVFLEGYAMETLPEDL